MYQLPTDSLYKFCALTGIILVLFSTFYPFSLSRDLSTKLENFNYEYKVMEAELAYTTTLIDNIEKIISTEVQIQNNTYKKDSSKLILMYSNSEIKEMYKQLLILKKENYISKANLERIRENMKQFISDIKFIMNIGYIGITIGGILTFFGFKMWWKIQKKQDKILANSILEEKYPIYKFYYKN